MCNKGSLSPSPGRFLNLGLSGFQHSQPVPDLGNFFVDGPQLDLGSLICQMIRSKLSGDVAFKLASKDSDIRVSPNRSFTMFEIARTNALNDKVGGHCRATIWMVIVLPHPGMFPS